MGNLVLTPVNHTAANIAARKWIEEKRINARVTQAPSSFAVLQGISNRPGRYGIIPYCNTVMGPFTDDSGLLGDATLPIGHDLRIVGHISLSVELHLAVRGQVPRDKISSIMAHDWDHRMCSSTVTRDWGDIRSSPTNSTKSLARLLSGHDIPDTTAIITSREEAGEHELRILQEGLEDKPSTTTFAVLKLPDPSGLSVSLF